MTLQDDMLKLVNEWWADALTQTDFLKGLDISKLKFKYWTQKLLRKLISLQMRLLI